MRGFSELPDVEANPWIDLQLLYGREISGFEKGTPRPYSEPVRGSAHWVSSSAAWLWFTALGLTVAGPLLGSGYLLLLDFPSGPQFPHVPVFPLPSSGDLGNGLPLQAIHALLRDVYQYLPDKVLLLAPILIGGFGLYRLAVSRLGVGALPALYGATLFVINPFVQDRYLSGHLYFLLAYSLLPWALAPIHDALLGQVRRAAPRVALWVALLAAIDVHVAGLYGLIAILAVVAAPARRLLFAGVAIGSAILLSAYWLLPAAFGAPGGKIGAADLAAYASRPRGFLVLPSLLSMHGFWRDEFPSFAQRFPGLYVLLVPILGLAVVGAAGMLTRVEERRFGAVLVAAAVLGLLLAAGTSFPPTAGTFRWIFDHVPLFGVYREPQKFLAVVVLAYAVFGAVGLHDVVTDLRARVLAWGPAVLAVTAVLAYGGGMFWGFGNEIHLSHYPPSWSRAERVMDDRGAGRLLVLPWHLYSVWSFSGGRITADPAGSFFSDDVLSASEAGFPSVPAQSPDPFRLYVSAALEHPGAIASFGHVVAPLGVRFVALLHEADWQTYRFLERQDDVRLLYDSDRISLYENLAWPGPVMALSAGSNTTSSAGALDNGHGQELTTELHPAPPLVSPQNDAFPPLARPLPQWQAIEPVVGATFVATGDRCTDGWRLGDESPLCDLGAVTAFSNPDQTDRLWRPLAGARLLGFALSAVALIGMGLYSTAVGRAESSPLLGIPSFP
jgi:hypothetical protein